MRGGGSQFNFWGGCKFIIQSAAHRWRTASPQVFSLEQKYARYLFLSRAHFRVTFDDLARSVEFNAHTEQSKLCQSINSCVTTLLLYQNPLSLIVTAPDGVKMLMKYCTTLLYGTKSVLLKRNGTSRCGSRRFIQCSKRWEPQTGYLESLEAASHAGTAVTISMSLSSQHLGMSLEPNLSEKWGDWPCITVVYKYIS